jgi:hypothetical protein
MAAAVTAGMFAMSPEVAPSTGNLQAALDSRSQALDEAVSRSQQRSPQPAVSAVPSPSITAPVKVKPVAGLSQKQMDNAATIVRVGREMGLPKRAWIIAVATAMQESDLHNTASEAVPESLKYPHEGTSIDHDSVGLFQQRASGSWGPVKLLMQPAYATRKFYQALQRVDGWITMTLTRAAQAVQISAYPDAYAKHERTATTVVNALT